MAETSPHFYEDTVEHRSRQARVARVIAGLSMLPPKVDLSLSEHIRRPGEVGSVPAQPTLFDQANAIIN